MKTPKQDGANVVKPLKKRKPSATTKDTSTANIHAWQKPQERGLKRLLSGNMKGASWLGGRNDVGRFAFIWGILIAFFILLIWRAFIVQVSNREFFLTQGSKTIIDKEKIPVLRGMITDTHGVPLAINAPLVSVVFDARKYATIYYKHLKNRQEATTPQAIAQADQALAAMDLKPLAAITGYPLERLEGLAEIQPNINARDQEVVKAALPKKPYSQRLILLNGVTPEVANSVLALKLAGLTREVKYQRYYMQSEISAQILGYMGATDEDKVYRGRSGLERQYDKQLSGQAGEMMVLRGNGHSVAAIGEITPVVAAQDLVLTIDSRLQYVLYKELERVGQAQQAMWASGIIVDISNGDILAMGAWPSFNNNNLNDIQGNEKNRPMVDAFEPGSVVKPFTVAAALESGKFTTSSLIDTGGGSLQMAGSLLHDGGAYGAITMATLIKKSSNIGSAKIALALPKDALVNMQRKFGLGKKTQVNFLGEASGKVLEPKEKDISHRITLSYGYGQEVTLAQLAQAYAALGNEGRFRALRLDKSKPVDKETQIISERHANDIVAMMELVTQAGGTGRAAAIEGYRVAGKTGTAKRYNLDAKAYHQGEHRALFVGMAPASRPRFVVAILVENPKDSSGGKAAAPVFSHVMQETLRMYNVPFDKALTKP